VVILTALACQSRRVDPGPSASASALPGVATPPVPSVPPSASGPLATPPGPSSDAGGRAAPVGGNWLKCYANFQPRTQPELEVMRLGLMCGPSNGMRKVTDGREAEVTDAGAGREHRWRAQAGDCYRIFAVGEPSVQDLDVEVFDPRGARIAWDAGDDRWPIVKPDGPFCVFEDGEYRAVVRAQRGAGRYAVEIWRLR
jgi:hypothetical protein